MHTTYMYPFLLTTNAQVTINTLNGRTMNLYRGDLTSGGSSGGSAAAVSGHVAPVAITEDTGGSTRYVQRPTLLPCALAFI